MLGRPRIRPLPLLLAAALAVTGVAVPAGAAHASTTASFDVTAMGGSNNAIAVGQATGSVTATRGTTTATYTVTLCGRSTYPSASVRIVVGNASVTHSVSYQNCQTFSGTLLSTNPISSGTATVSGATFYPGNTYTTYSKSRTLSF